MIIQNDMTAQELSLLGRTTQTDTSSAFADQISATAIVAQQEEQSQQSGIPMGEAPTYATDITQLKDQLLALVGTSYDRTQLEDLTEEEQDQKRFEAMLSMVDSALGLETDSNPMTDLLENLI